MKHSQTKVEAFKQFMRENPPRELTPAQSRAKQDRFELTVAEWQGQADIEADHYERARLQDFHRQRQVIREQAMACDNPYEHLIRTMDQQEREFKLNRQKNRRILLSGNEAAICKLFNRNQWFDHVGWEMAEVARIEEEEQRTRDAFKAQVEAETAERAASGTAPPPESTPWTEGASASEEELRIRAEFRGKVEAARAERAASLPASPPTPATSPRRAAGPELALPIRDEFKEQEEASRAERATSSTTDSTSSPRDVTSPILTPEDDRNLDEIFEALAATNGAGSDASPAPNSQIPSTSQSNGNSIDIIEDEEGRNLALEAAGSHKVSEEAHQRALQRDVLAAVEEEKMSLEMEARRRVINHNSSLGISIDIEQEKKRQAYRKAIKLSCADSGRSFQQSFTLRPVKGPGTLLRLARAAAEAREASNVSFSTLFPYRFDACWGF